VTYAVTLSVSGGGGSVNPDTGVSVLHGGSTSFAVTVTAGYTAVASGCSGSPTSPKTVDFTYTTGSITSACTVTVTFTPGVSKAFGGSGDDSVASVATDANGNITIVGGFTSSSISFGGTTHSNALTGAWDLYIAKFDPTLGYLGSRTFGGDSSEAVTSVAIDANGNIVITGNFHSPALSLGGTSHDNAGDSDIFVAKYDSSFGYLGSKVFGGPNYDRPLSVAVDAAGNIAVAGYFRSPTISFGGTSLPVFGTQALFVAKFNPSLEHLASNSFGGDSTAEVRAVTFAANGDLAIVGNFQSTTISFGGSTHSNAGSLNAFVAKFDSSLGFLASKAFGGSGTDGANSVAFDANGNVYVVGNFHSATISFGSDTHSNVADADIYLAKFDSNLEYVASKTFGGADYDYPTTVTVSPNGNLAVTGQFRSSSISFGGVTHSSVAPSNLFVAEFDFNLGYLASQTFSGAATAGAVDAGGNLAVAGTFATSTISFGGPTYSNAGSNDIFLAKFRGVVTHIASLSVTGGGGSVNPNSGVTVLHGQSTSFNVTVTAGYTAVASGCSGVATSPPSAVDFTYTTGSVTAACTVTVAYTPVTSCACGLHGTTRFTWSSRLSSKRKRLWECTAAETKLSVTGRLLTRSRCVCKCY